MSATNSDPLWKRLWQYQAERFPLFKNGPLIAIFAFSSASFSRLSRGAEGFIPIGNYIVGAITAILFFALLRIADEFKDAADDASYRPYRAVPRGLVSLRELRWAGFIILAIIVVLNILFLPRMLPVVALVLGYMGLMTAEFFVPSWLKARPLAYLATHMMIVPFFDFYTTGLDWINGRATPSWALLLFLLVTYCNTLAIEIGRKIRAPEFEEHGVETYSALYGPRRATIAWLAILSTSLVLAIVASTVGSIAHDAGRTWAVLLLAVVFLVPLIVSRKFLASVDPSPRDGRSVDNKYAARFETISGLWVASVYIMLGAVPMLLHGS